MPVTIQQRLERALIDLTKRPNATNAEILKAAKLLIQVRRTSKPRKVRAAKQAVQD